jgi:hypothetical protein
MYALWIQKPYNVNEPTVISADVTENALAFIVASSRWEGKSGFLRTSCKAADLEDEFDEFYETRLRRSRDPRLFYYGALKKTPQVIPRKVSNSFGNQEIPLENLHDLRLKNHFLRANVAELKTTIDLDVAYYPGERVGNYYNISNGIQPTLFLSSGQALRTGLGPKIQLEYEHLIPGVQIGLSDKDLNRLNMTGAFISDALSLTEEHGHSSNLLSQKKGCSSSEPFDPFNVEIVNRRGRRLVCQRENNMLFSGALIDILETVREPGLESGRPWHFALLVVALITIPTAYGGIHLSTLHAMFPTRIESILWKASCFTLLSFAGFLFLSMIISWFPLTLWDWSQSSRFGEKPRWSLLAKCRLAKTIIQWTGIAGILALLLIVFAATLLYIGARVFIVVESFISLKHVPIGVYQSPPTNFMGYIPHL